MFKHRILIGSTTLCLALLYGGVWAAQMEADGLIVKVQNGLLFIDAGAKHGVMEGDLFNILSPEVVAHPLTGDTLAVSTRSVGALRVRQVYERMALAELVHLEEGHDPMLLQVGRIRDPERLLKIQNYVQQRKFIDSGSEVARSQGLVPGLYQMRTGAQRKGWGIMGLEAVALIAAIGYRLDSNDWYDQYGRLPDGLPEREYEFYFGEASDRRSLSNRLFWLAGAVYAYNWIDVLWMGQRATMHAAAVAPRPWSVGMGLDQERHALLQVTRRF